jgi:hypothetical protein
MSKGFLASVIVAVAFLLSACGGGTHSRGQFQGHVVGTSGDEIQTKMGKPDSVDEKDPAKPRWVYNKKTFDPDNFNKVDEKVIIILERNPQGKLVGKDVIFG